VYGLNGRRLNEASERIIALLSRCHDPRAGDDVAALGAIDVLALAGQYSLEQFADDCITIVGIRNVRADDDAAEIEREKLSKERAALVADFERRAKLPHDRSHDYASTARRKAELDRDVERLERKHETRNIKFRELAARSSRAYEALKQTGFDLRHR
jgi:hypothetical protein